MSFRLIKSVGFASTLLLLAAGCNHDISMQQVDRMVRPQEDRRYVAVNALNLRTCPATTCRIIRVLQEGDSGLVLKEDSGWVEMLIDHSDSQGWVAARYLSHQAVTRKQEAAPQAKKKAAPPPGLQEELAEPLQKAPAPLQEELATQDLGAVPGGADPEPVLSEEFGD